MKASSSTVLTFSGLTLLGIFAGALPSAAQAPQVLAKPLEYEVGVVLKLVHVYVTDKKGKPVPDLARDDFLLVDNGTQVTITEFEKHTLSPTPAEPRQSPALGTPVVRQASRKFFLFFDLAFNNPRGMAKAKEAAFYFLDTQARPEDEIGVVSYSTFGGIKVHEFLTKDHSKIRNVLEKIDQGVLAGRAEEIEDRYWRLISESGSLQDDKQERRTLSSIYIYEAMAEREQLKMLTQTFVLSLTTLAKALRSLPGQKQFILFSTGVPSSLVYGNQAGNRYLEPQATSRGAGIKFDPGDPTLKAINEAMYKEFAASACAFYAFDTRASAKGMELFGYDELAAQGAASISGTRAVYGDSTRVFRDGKTAGVDFLKRFSDITAGRYFSNINAYEKNLDQIQALTGTYYVLGYPIREQWDGRFHDIKVKVNRAGCEVQAQAGYFNPKPFSEYTKLEKRLHLYDLALNERALSRLPVNISMIPLVYGGGAESRLGIIALVPGEVTQRLSGRRIECVVIFFDDEGEVSNVVRAETASASYRGRAMFFTASAELEPGAYSCRLVVRDMSTGLSAVASARATLGTPRPAGLHLSTPLILTEGATGSYFDAGPARKRDALPLAEAYAYDRSRLSPMVAELPAAAASIQAIIPYSATGEAEPDLAFSAYAIDANSAVRTSVTFSRIERARSGPQGLLAFEIPVAGLAPGTYFLHFHAEDRVSRSIGHTFATLVVPQR